MEIRPIAHIRTDFPTKFGVPRQSGLTEELTGIVVFENEFRNPDCLRGLAEFSHIWLIWGFSAVGREGWSATVRPPRLGGNTRKGVFATRSPFRPNPLGLSCVRLTEIRHDEKLGDVLVVSGIDMMDGTPVYDVKPYIPVTDLRADATEGYTAMTREHALTVDFPEELLALVPKARRDAAIAALRQDPRPGYSDDPLRRYGMEFAGTDIRFTVSGDTLHVVEVRRL